LNEFHYFYNFFFLEDENPDRYYLNLFSDCFINEASSINSYFFYFLASMTGSEFIYFSSFVIVALIFFSTEAN